MQKLKDVVAEQLKAAPKQGEIHPAMMAMIGQGDMLVVEGLQEEVGGEATSRLTLCETFTYNCADQVTQLPQEWYFR